jgi:hypothetical protein
MTTPNSTDIDAVATLITTEFGGFSQYNAYQVKNIYPYLYGPDNPPSDLTTALAEQEAEWVDEVAFINENDPDLEDVESFGEYFGGDIPQADFVTAPDSTEAPAEEDKVAEEPEVEVEAENEPEAPLVEAEVEPEVEAEAEEPEVEVEDAPAEEVEGA